MLEVRSRLDSHERDDYARTLENYVRCCFSGGERDVIVAIAR